MANAYSQPLSYNDTLDITDVAKFSGQVQGQMQKKFDINLAKIEDLAGQIASAPLVREKDKQYLGNRLHQMLQSVDKNAKLNLTDNAAVSQINSYISGAIDENVKKQINNSLKISQFNNEVNALKVKDPKLYNDNNVAYAYHKSGLDTYMAGESDDLGSLSYTPYVDKSKVLDELKKIKDLKGDQTVEIPDGNGRVTIKKIDGLSEAEIYQYMPQLLSSDILNQIKIDGWAKYKDNIPQAQQDFKKYSDSKIQSLNDDVEEAEATYNNSSLSKAQRDQAKKILDNKKLEKVDTEDFLKNVNIQDPEQLGYFLEKGSYQYSLAKIASGRMSTTYKSDDYFFDRKKLDLSIAKNNREEAEFGIDMQLKQKDSLLKDEQIRLKKLEADTKSGVVGEGSTGAYVQTPLNIKLEEEKIDALKDITNDYNTEHSNIISSAWTAYNGDNTSEEQKRQFRASLAKKGYSLRDGKLMTLQGKKHIADQYLETEVIAEAFSASNMNVSYPQISKDINNSEVKAAALSGDLSDVNTRSFVEEFKANPTEYIKQLKIAERNTRNPGPINQLVSTFPIDNPLTSNFKNKEVELKKVNSQINTFIKDNGGIDNVATTIQDSPEKVRKLAELVKLGNSLAGIRGDITDFISTDGLYEKATKKANEILIQKNQQGGGGYFKTLNQYNIIDKEEKKRIINLIPQDEQSANSALFADNLNITVVPKSDGKIELRQNKGMGSKDGDPVQKAPALYIAEPGTAIYNYLNSKVEFTGKNNGLDARTAKTLKIKPYSPPSFIDKGDDGLLSKADAVMLNLNPAVSKEFNAPPANYLNETRTKDKFKQVLQGRMPEDDLNYVLNNVSKSLDNFDIVLKPIDGVWGATIESKLDKTVKIKNGKFTKTSSNLDKDMLELVRNYPQVLILDNLLMYLSKHPEDAKTIIKP